MAAKTKSAEHRDRTTSERSHSRSYPPAIATAEAQDGLLPSFQQAAGNLAIQHLMRSQSIQAKLTVNRPGDRYEQEADRVAEQVMRMPAQSNPPRIQRLCTGCEEEMQLDPSAVKPSIHSLPVGIQRRCAACEDQHVQAKEHPGQPTSVSPALTSRIQKVKRGGHSLPAPQRAFFESRFKRDLRDVRVHADAQAADTARAIHARAFTTGNDIIFGAGQYRPETTKGRRLLAHELTHVIQQTGGADRSAGTIQRQEEATPEVSQADAAECTGFVFDYNGVINGTPEDEGPPSKPRNYFAHIGKKPLGPLVDGRKATVGRHVFTDSVNRVWLGVCAKRSDMPAQIMWVLEDYVDKEVKTPEKKQKKKPPATGSGKKEATPKPKKTSKHGRVKKRLSGIPRNERWTSPRGLKGKTYSAINYVIAAKDFYFNPPLDPAFSHEILDRIQTRFVEVHITDSNFDKKFAHMSGFARTGLHMLFLSGKSAVKAIQNKIATGQIRPGSAGGEAAWRHELNHFKSAYEIMEVLSGDLDAKQSENLRALDTATSGKAVQALIDGFLEGAKSKLSDADYKALSQKLAGSQVLSVIAPPIILSGAAVGIAKDIGEALKGLYELITDPAEMAKNMMDLIQVLLFDEAAARVLGQAIGEESGKELHDLAGENIAVFTFKLGELIGPMVVYTALSIASAGAVGGAAVSTRLASFLAKYPKVSKSLSRLKAMVPNVPKEWAVKTLRLSAETAKDLTQAGVNRLRMLPDAVLERISKLSKRAKRWLFGCASDCDVDIDAINRRLQFTDAEIEAWASGIPEAAKSPKVTGKKRPMVEAGPGKKKRVPTKRERRLEADEIPRRPGEDLVGAIARIRTIVGKKLSDYGAIRKAWDRARKHVLSKETLTKDNVAQVYAKARRRFWTEIRMDDDALKLFREAGFYMPEKEGAAYLGGVKPHPTRGDVPIEEIRLSLDHSFEKARADNWRMALDADNLTFEFHNPNSFREIAQMRHPELRPD